VDRVVRFRQRRRAAVAARIARGSQIERQRAAPRDEEDAGRGAGGDTRRAELAVDAPEPLLHVGRREDGRQLEQRWPESVLARQRGSQAAVAVVDSEAGGGGRPAQVAPILRLVRRLLRAASSHARGILRAASSHARGILKHRLAIVGLRRKNW